MKREVNPIVHDLLHRADALNSTSVYDMASWKPQVRWRGIRHARKSEGSTPGAWSLKRLRLFHLPPWQAVVLAAGTNDVSNTTLSDFHHILSGPYRLPASQQWTTDYIDLVQEVGRG